MKLVYPACFYPEENGGYCVDIPDLPGCVTCGSTLSEAIDMGIDAASGWILGELEDGNPVPQPSRLSDVTLEYENGFVSLLNLDIDAYAEKYSSKAVRKNLTIPAWLNTYAEANNINFSNVLRDALSAMYQESIGA